MEDNSNEILGYLTQLEKIYGKRIDYYDHFYSGDKDTFIEAYNLIINDKYQFGDYYDHSVEQIKLYHNSYKNEIETSFKNLVDYRNEIIKKLENMITNIKDIKEFELYYMGNEERREYLINNILEK